MKEKINKKMKSLSNLRKGIQEKLSDIIFLILIVASRMETAVVVATCGLICHFEADFGLLYKAAVKITSFPILLLILTVIYILAILSYKEIKSDQRLLMLAVILLLSYLIIIGFTNINDNLFVSIGNNKITTIATAIAIIKILFRLDGSSEE